MLSSGWQLEHEPRRNTAEKFSPACRRIFTAATVIRSTSPSVSRRHTRETNGRRLRRLNASNKAPFSAFLRLEHGAILSLSPERFIHLAGGMIQTRPIKGTLPRLADSPTADRQQAETLAASPKDRAENLMIVDLMRNDIGRVAVPGSVRVPELFVVEPFPAVHHLVSTITARLPATLHRQRSAARRVSRRLHYRRAESPGDGDYRRTGARIAATPGAAASAM